MPQLIFHGVKSDDVKTCSTALVEELAQVMETSTDNFLLEVINSVQIFNGREEVKPYPFVDVRWFERGQVVQDASAAVITQHLNRVGYDPVDVIFTALRKNAYYENSTHFDT